MMTLVLLSKSVHANTLALLLTCNRVFVHCGNTNFTSVLLCEAADGINAELNDFCLYLRGPTNSLFLLLQLKRLFSQVIQIKQPFSVHRLFLVESTSILLPCFHYVCLNNVQVTEALNKVTLRPTVDTNTPDNSG